MKACIAYSFFGTDCKYVSGINRTIRFLMPDGPSRPFDRTSYSIFVYTDSSSSEFLCSHIINHPLVRIFLVSAESILYSVRRSWRYSIIFSSEIREFDFCLFRDADSVVNSMEIELIDRWLDSSFSYSVIRGCSLHTWPIMAGLFGVKASSYDFLKQALCKSAFLTRLLPDSYSLDQLVLALFVYPFIVDSLGVFTCTWYYHGENVIPIRESPVCYPGAYLSGSDSSCDLSTSLMLNSSENPEMCKAPPFAMALPLKFSVRFFFAWNRLSSSSRLFKMLRWIMRSYFGFLACGLALQAAIVH